MLPLGPTINVLEAVPSRRITIRIAIRPSMAFNLGPPPPGGDQDLGPSMRNAAIISFTVAVFLLVLRIYTRGLLVRRTGWDDYTMVAATVSRWID